MTSLRNTIHRTLVLSALFGFAAVTASWAQERLPDPVPQEARAAILDAFKEYSIVGMMAGHGIKDVDDFILSLIRQPSFPEIVNDIVVECTNSMYQGTLDRYISGEDVPFEEAKQAWYNTQPGCTDSHEALFPLVRRINQRLPRERRLRVLAGEPPVDWNAVATREQARDFLSSGIREGSMAAIVQHEVLGKGRKALLLYGTGHLMRTIPASGLTSYERQYPRATFVIDVLAGCVVRTAEISQDISQDLDRRFATWPVPSLARIRNTSITDVGAGQFMIGGRLTDWADAVLYLGPSDLLVRQPLPAHIWMDSTYMAQLRRRLAVPGSASARAKSVLDPEKILASEADPFVCEAPRRDQKQ